MEVMIGVAILATLGFAGFKVAETANGITMRYDVSFYSAAFYFGVAGGALSVLAVPLIFTGQALNGFALEAIGCGLIYWGYTSNLQLIPNRGDAIKLTVIQVVTGFIVALLMIALEVLKAQARR